MKAFRYLLQLLRVHCEYLLKLLKFIFEVVRQPFWTAVLAG